VYCCYYYYFRTLFITNFLNSVSELFSLIFISLKASSPTRYLNFGGFSDVTAFKVTFATIAEEPFSNLGLNPEPSFVLFVHMVN
jgi:hypothetical protein